MDARTQFEFEKLDVYHASVRFYDLARAINRTLAITYLEEKNELKRAALSVMLNICEASGEFSRAEKARFYRMSLRSATESAGLIRLLEHDLGVRDLFSQAAEVLLRLVAMLTALVNRNTRPHA